MAEHNTTILIKHTVEHVYSILCTFLIPRNIPQLALSLPEWATDKISPNVMCLQLGTPYFQIQGNPHIMRGHDGNVLVGPSAQRLASTSEWGSLTDSVCSDLLSPASVPRAQPMTCTALLDVIRRTGVGPLMIPVGIQFHLWLIGMLTA